MAVPTNKVTGSQLTAAKYNALATQSNNNEKSLATAMSTTTYDAAGISEQLVGVNATQTLFNKMLETPKIDGGLNDNDNNIWVGYGKTGGGSAVNYILLTNAAAGSNPLLTVEDSDDTNVSLNLRGKGTGTVQLDGVPIATTTGTQALTNKRIDPRTNTISSSATPTPAGDTTDIFTVTALATNATFSEPTGTPVNGQSLVIRIKDDGTARTLAWNAVYRGGTDVPLPATTTLSKTLYCAFVYNNDDSVWDIVGVTDGI